MRCDRPTDLGANYAFTAQHYQRLRQPCQTDQHRHSDTILIYQNLIPPKHRADDKRRRGAGRATTVIRARPSAASAPPPSSSSVRLWHHVLLAISLSLSLSQPSIISLPSSVPLSLSSSSFELGEKSHQQRDHRRRVDHLLPLGAD